MTTALPPSFDFDPGRRLLRLDPRDPAFFADPYPSYAALHGLAPHFLWEEVGCRAVVEHRTISAILRDRRFGRVLPVTAGRADYSAVPDHLQNFYALERHSLLDLEPPTHTRLRSLVTRAFVARRVEKLEPAIAARAEALIDRFEARGSVELVSEFAALLPIGVIAELIGIGDTAHADMLDWSHRMVAMYQFGRTPEIEHAADGAAAEFAAFMREAIAVKRRHPGDDLISALILAEDQEGRLGEEEMVSTLILLMNAGHEASVHQIGNAVRSILDAELGVAALGDGREQSMLVAEEALRFDTPLHLFRRIALEDVELSGGALLRRGEEVALLLAAGNRDPRVFADPDRFDPQRRGGSHLSFGAGIHFCVGAALARLELVVALERLFARLPGLRLDGAVTYRDSYHFRGLTRLDLAFG